MGNNAPIGARDSAASFIKVRRRGSYTHGGCRRSKIAMRGRDRSERREWMAEKTAAPRNGMLLRLATVAPKIRAIGRSSNRDHDGNGRRVLGIMPHSRSQQLRERRDTDALRDPACRKTCLSKDRDWDGNGDAVEDRCAQVSPQQLRRGGRRGMRRHPANA